MIEKNLTRIPINDRSRNFLDFKEDFRIFQILSKCSNFNISSTCIHIYIDQIPI